MEYRSIDNLGIKTSLLGFGCMRFPTTNDGSIDMEKTEMMVDMAYKAGVNYYDTAYVYHGGKSELVIGSLLDKYDRSSYYLATKLPCWNVHSVDDAKKLFEEQLTKLHKDYIDFYLLHAMGRSKFDEMVSLGVVEYLEQLQQEGKIKYLGFSFHDNFDAFSHIINFRKWDFCQIQLNYMDTDSQAGIKGYELADELHVPLIIMEPIKGGVLSNLPESAAKLFKESAPDLSISSWALRWVGSLPNAKVILSGMSDLSHVEDNLKTFSPFVALNNNEQLIVEKTIGLINTLIKNNCSSCSYCMPCPSGVNIPHNFRIWNEFGMYNSIGATKWGWEHGIDDDKKAKNCSSCGKCEKVCPQKISIRADLKSLQLELDQIK